MAMLTDCVSDGPGNEVHGDSDGLLRLTCDVSRNIVSR